MSSSISLPLVVWHNFVNPHTTCLVAHYPYVYAGQKDGQIWAYAITDNNLSLQHRFLLAGHKAPVVALTIVPNGKSTASSESFLISAAEDGEIARWSAADGRCLAVNPKGFFGVPHDLKYFDKFSKRHLFCSGQTNEICILNATTLEVVRVWGSHSNWVTCTDIHDGASGRRKLLTITIDGRLDIWDFDLVRQVVYKERAVDNQPALSNGYQVDMAFDLQSNPDIPGLCMTVTRKSVMIFILRNATFVPQITINADEGTSWSGGQFCGRDKLILWSQAGTIREYALNAPQGVQPGTMASQESQLYYSITLLRTSTFDHKNTLPTSGLWTTTLCHCRPENTAPFWATVTFCNHTDDAMFSINRLTSPDEKADQMITCQEHSLRDRWPITNHKDPSFGSITATVPVSTNHLAVGYEDGSICVVPLSLALLHLNDLSQRVKQRHDCRVFERAHNGQVTCMIVHESHHHQFLLSGGRDGAVKIWNLVDGKYVVSFTVHALPVKSFIEPAEQHDSRIRGCVVSVAKDNSLALISVDAMDCLFMFPSHSYPLSTIQWRTAEDYLVFGYTDETAYVWQMATGCLDRILTGKNFQSIMDDDRWPVNRLLGPSKPSLSTKLPVTLRGIISENQATRASTHFGLAFTFNVRRLIHDLCANLETATLEQHELVPQKSVSTSSYDDADRQENDPLDEEENNRATRRDADRLKKLELCTAVLSAILSWNVSEALEDTCKNQFGMVAGATNGYISSGFRGVNDFLSLMAPFADEKEAWRISQTTTASRLLAIVVLAKAIMLVHGQEARSADLAEGYAMALPAVVGSEYCLPSLSFLSKYWQDPSARSLFKTAVTGMSEDQIQSLLDYWSKYLPTSSSPESNSPQMMVRATIVLGIMGCDEPQMLSKDIRKYTALSLALLLTDSDLDEPQTATSPDPQAVTASSVARMLAAMELLSQGFPTWEVYINAAEILRTLFQYASDGSSPTVSRGAKNAVFCIANTNMPLVIGTLTYDAVHAKKTNERERCLRLIGSFIRKRPTLLYSSVQRVVEAVVKTLDPNVPHLREVVLPTATAVLHDLVKTYPSVDFSSSAQKLVVGTLEGASVIYDLRTATRSVVLEGHTGPVVALAFSPDAKYVATSSLLDKTVRVWYSNLSLFGVLTSSLSHGLLHHESPNDSRDTGSQKAYKTFGFALPNVSPGTDPSQLIHQVHFEWSSIRSVRLHVRDLVMSFNF